MKNSSLVIEATHYMNLLTAREDKFREDLAIAETGNIFGYNADELRSVVEIYERHAKLMCRLIGHYSANPNPGNEAELEEALRVAKRFLIEKS